jgi:hypothetical protein
MRLLFGQEKERNTSVGKLLNEEQHHFYSSSFIGRVFKGG